MLERESSLVPWTSGNPPLAQEFHYWAFPALPGYRFPETWDYRIPDRDGPVIAHGRANVFNMFASTSHWLFSHIGGIRPDPENPGFENVIIHPEIGGGITCADVTYDSVRGPIRSHWWIKDRDPLPNALFLQVSIPPNTTADVYIPAEDMMSIWIERTGESDVRAVVADGVEGISESEDQEGLFILELESGDYTLYSVSNELLPEVCPTGTCPCGSDS